MGPQGKPSRKPVGTAKPPVKDPAPKRKPKTAAGRAGANLRAAEAARKRNPRDKKAANKLNTAKAAREWYRENGGGRKGAAKPQREPKPTTQKAQPSGKSAARQKNGVINGKGTAAARSGVTRAKQKAGTNPTPGQKGAVTRATNKLKKAKAENTSRKQLSRKSKSGVVARPKGWVRPGTQPKAQAPKAQPKAKAAGSKPKGKGPKTAGGRASANLRRAQAARAANPNSKKARQAFLTARAAQDWYKANGGGRKGAAKPMRKAAGTSQPKASKPKAGAKLKAQSNPKAQPTTKAQPKPNAQTSTKPKGKSSSQEPKAMRQAGTIPGRFYQDGKPRRAESAAELRAAVLKNDRTLKNPSELRMAALGAGITQQGRNGLATGRMPKTREDWAKLHRKYVGVPQSERGLAPRPGVVNGLDIYKNFRPNVILGVKPGASTQEINSAFRQAAKKAHPDAGGRAKDLQRLKVMRDSLISTSRPLAPTKPSAKKTKNTSQPAKPRGPLLLPPARRRRRK